MLLGIMPLVSYRNAVYMNNEVPGIQIPTAYVNRFSPEMSREEAQRTGIEIALEIAESLRPHADGFYFMTPFNRAEIVAELIEKCREIKGGVKLSLTPNCKSRYILIINILFKRSLLLSGNLQNVAASFVLQLITSHLCPASVAENTGRLILFQDNNHSFFKLIRKCCEISKGSRSFKSSVALSSLGSTIRPRPSILLTIPVEVIM